MAEFCAVCSRRRTSVGGCSCAGVTPPVALPPSGPVPALYPAAPGLIPLRETHFDSNRRTLRRALVIAASVLVVAGTAVTAAVVAVQFNDRPSAPVAGASVGDRHVYGTTTLPGYNGPTATVPVNEVSIVDAAASCTSGPGEDSAGNPFTYEARNAIDGLPDSAWRCDQDGVGEVLLLTLSRPAAVAWIAVIPGFAKTDPYDGTDRYLQCRRVSAARFVFDDGTYVEHGFDVTSLSRSPQVVTFPARVTTQIQVIVLASTPGSPTNGQNATDKIAISEVTVGQ